ncbi:MAG: LrgB family protein [Ketobacter sp.]|nr:LrgB family protein [Ketobacter sp.]
MTEYLSIVINFPLFGVLITVAAFYLGQRLYARSNRHPVLQPVVIGMAAVISTVLVLRVPYESYYESSYLLHAMLGPATVALAIPLFQHARRIRDLLLPIICTVLVGGAFTVGVALLILWMLDANLSTMLSMPTKSITTPIAMIVTEQLGGIPALSAMFVLLTGAVGAMIGIPLMNRMGIKDDGVKGFTMGLTSHALGTARALEESAECGAFSALAMSMTGVMTAVLIPIIAAWLL